MRRISWLLVPVALFAGQVRYARLGDFQGKVEVQLQASGAWMPAERNLPLTEAAWLRTGPASRVEIELDEGSVWRAGPNAQFEISDYSKLSTGQRVTLLSLDQGLGYFTGQAEGRDSLMVAVPGAQVTVTKGARVRLEVQEHWSQIAVIEGTVRFSSPAAEMDLREGQTTRVEPANPTRFFLYKDVPPQDLDRWSEERDKALESSTSAQHTIHRYGLNDLDTNGEWIVSDELGDVWKPKIVDGWTPYQKGRWRWYDTLGYTWVSDDAWGWLPYHHGRWTRTDTLGWIWVPSRNSIFKPGDVYWMRGNRIAAWGPLAPGEQWLATVSQPQLFVKAHTTFAAFPLDAATIDPTGFTDTPKDPLAAMAFAEALPSPAFLAAKLEQVRPILRSGVVRVTPAVDGVVFGSGAAPATGAAEQPAPVVIITQPAPPPPPPLPPDIGSVPPVVVPVPILVPMPIGNPDYFPRPRPGTASSAGQPKPGSATTTTASNSGSNPSTGAAPAPITGVPPIFNPKPRDTDSKTSKREHPPITPPRTPLPSAAPDPKNADKRPAASQLHFVPPSPRNGKNFQPGERRLVDGIVDELNREDFAGALHDLDAWSQKNRETQFGDERLYYYMQAHHALGHSENVLANGHDLMLRNLNTAFKDPLQIVSVLYLTSWNYQKVAKPTHDQRLIGKAAAVDLLAVVPLVFKQENRPEGTTADDWRKAKTDLETLGKQTLTLAGDTH